MPDAPSWGDDITASPAPADPAPLVPPPPSAGVPPAAERPPADGPAAAGWSWRSTAITLVVLAVVGAGALWFLTRGSPVSLEVDGRPIANAETVLARAEAALADLVEADGAAAHEDAGCWFAPPEEPRGVTRGPQLACGPVLLGVSGTSEPWVLGSVDYSTAASGEQVTGTFRSLDSVGDPDTGDFARPDGRGAPSTSDLVPATEGIRSEDGRRIVNAEGVIESADEDFADVVEDASASVTDDSACFFGGSRSADGRFLADREVWCGPVLLVGSRPTDTWTRWSFSVGSGPSFALAEASPPTISQLNTTVRLSPGLDLARPDGREVPDDTDIEPPDAEALDEDTVEVLTDLPGDVDFEEPQDGRLVVPSRTLHLNGLARVAKVGAGAEALVAPADHDLVVVDLALEPHDDGPSDRGTAQLVVDGTRIPFSDWGSLPERGFLVMTVPEDAEVVDLEVLFDGLTQRISLLTGERQAGYPAALYRETTSVGVGENLRASAPLPAGDPAVAGGVITEARLAAWTSDLGWAPKGTAFLLLSTESWQVTRPCCDVSDVTITPIFAVTPTGGTPIAGAPITSSSNPTPAFTVPADFTSGQVDLVVRVTFTHQGNQGAVDSERASLALEVPG